MGAAFAFTVGCVVIICIVPFSLAGIVGLSKYLRTTYKPAWVKDVRTLGTLQVDHLCIDMNQVLHGCFRSSRNPDHVMAKIFLKLDDIFKIAMPKKSLVLAFDGPAPYAKVQTQRERRRAHPESCLITPGTDFMNSMESIMICYVLQRYRKFGLDSSAVFISDGTCPGEGELKIIDWIRTHMPSPTTQHKVDLLASSGIPDIHTADSVLICGSDSDILVQSLCMGQVSPNTAVLQISSEGPDALCNISALRAGLVQATGVRWREMSSADLTAQTAPGEEQERLAEPAPATVSGDTQQRTKVGVPDVRTQLEIAQLPSLHLDLVVLFALQGNDYLPKMRSISNTRALQAYGHAMNALPVEQRYLVDLKNGTFNFPALWLLTRYIHESCALFPVALPLVVPDPLLALHNVLLKRQRAQEESAPSAAHLNTTEFLRVSLNWEETLVEGSEICILASEDKAAEPEYFMRNEAAEQHVENCTRANRTSKINFYLEQAARSEPLANSAGDNMRLWRACAFIMGRKYSSSQLATTKRAARRRLAELVLRDLDDGAYTEYAAAKATARSTLLQMRWDAATEQTGDGAKSAAPGEIATAPAGVSAPAQSDASDGADAAADMEEVDEPDVVLTEDEDGVDAAASGAYPRRLDLELEVGGTAEVAPEEYLKYLRDADIEHYLNGLLWIAHMYACGECPDISYTYNGRPPMTALAIRRYIERRAAEDSTATWDISNASAMRDYGDAIRTKQAVLAEAVKVPVSTQRSLSADATCLCVLPEEGVEYLPPGLRNSWAWINKNFYDQLDASNLNSIPYEALVAGLQQCFDANRGDCATETLELTPSAIGVDASDDDGSTSAAHQARGGPTPSRAERRQLASVRKGTQAWARIAQGGNSTDATSDSTTAVPITASLEGISSTRQGANGYGTLETVLMPDPHNGWTVLARPATLAQRGYRGCYLPKRVTLPLPLSFRSPSRLPLGAQFFRIEGGDLRSSHSSSADILSQSPLEESGSVKTETSKKCGKARVFAPSSMAGDGRAKWKRIDVKHSPGRKNQRIV